MASPLLTNFTGALYRQEGHVGAYQVLLPYLTMRDVMRRYMPTEYGESFGLMKDNQIQAAFREKDFEAVAHVITETSKNGFPKEWQDRWKHIDAELTKDAFRFVSMDMSALSREQLKEEYDRMHAIDEDMWAISIFIDAFDAGFDQKEIERISALHGITAEEAHVLTSPYAPSYMTEVATTFSNAHASGNLAQAVEQFFWYGTNYSEFEEVDEAFIERTLSTMHPSPFESPREEEKKILAAHGLTQNPLELFRTLTVWRDERKRLNYTGLYVLVKILREAARRSNIDPALVNGLIPYQVHDFIDGVLPAETLRKQLEEGMMFHITSDGKFEYLFGTEATSLWDEIETLYVAGHAAVELKGTVASKGKATGKVRIVQNPTGVTIEKGEILVTSMTRPEFLPLMKLAGAIVTDEGGITSHAAIVSRELRIPCVIGAKVACKTLHDGDMVEVDAEKGIVKKI